MKTLRIAIFYDWLNNWGGAERVLLNLLQVYPHAEIFTLVHNPAKTKWLPKKIKIHTSFLNNLPLSKSNPIFYTALYTLAIEQFDFSNFDIIISTTSTIGMGLITPPPSLFVTYFHNINRHLYLHPPKILEPLLILYRQLDQYFVKRSDYYICNSKTVATRLNHFYKISPTVIYPGVDTSKFKPIKNPTLNYFLIVGRQVPHKKIDMVIEYFINHPQKQLIIAGNGPIHNQLLAKSMGKNNISFISHPTDTQLVKLYQNSLALICPQLEDFGLTTLESQAAGRPVIAFNQGGCTETILDGTTGILFDKQTSSSLGAALKIFGQTKFSPSICRSHSLKFSDRHFMLNFRHHLNKLWTKHQTTTS